MERHQECRKWLGGREEMTQLGYEVKSQHARGELTRGYFRLFDNVLILM